MPVSTSLATLLKAWTQASAFEHNATEYDANGVVTRSMIRWPDGTGGVFETSAFNTSVHEIDAYDAYYPTASVAVHQAQVTRNSDGLITVMPQLTIIDIPADTWGAMVGKTWAQIQTMTWGDLA